MKVINDADREIAYAVEREIPAIARAVDQIAERLEGGGRLFYVGAGTSGRRARVVNGGRSTRPAPAAGHPA